MTMGKNQKIVLGLVGLALVASVAYAIFSTSLNVFGSAGTSGNWEVLFTNAEVTIENKSSNATINLSGDGKTATIVAEELQEPGAYATFTITVHNSGTIDGKLNAVDVTPTVDDENIKITNTAPAVNSILNAGDTITFTVTVAWDSQSDSTTTGHTFSISLDYRQNV